MKFVLTCNSGLESLAKQEVVNLGYDVEKVDDRLLFIKGNLQSIADINLRSRVGNKLFMIVKTGFVNEFEDLFQLITKVEWSQYINNGQGFVVQATSVKSQLSSVPAIQSVSQKAIMTQLTGSKELKRIDDGAQGILEIHVIINNNKAYLLINTTGPALHKRGYRVHTVEAPMKENIAAGLIMLSAWDKKTPLHDFFCGSGTITIEAAMMARNVAPGKLRQFDFEKFYWYEKSYYEDALQKAISNEVESSVEIFGYDMDPLLKGVQQEHAKKAGVESNITFVTKDFIDIDDQDFDNIFFISNPPYGIRLSPANIKPLYDKIADFFEFGKNIQGGIFTSFNDFYKTIDSKQYKLRKLFNGGEKCHFYRFLGKR
ncbi:MAG: hypothetical protein V3575_05615 [Candidatus Absconditabacteria bacterium]